MSTNNLDLVVLHYAITSKKCFLELIKTISQEYFVSPFSELYAILQSCLTNSSINEILGLPGLADYCDRHNLVSKKEILCSTYSDAVALTLSGSPPKEQDFSYFLSALRERYNKTVVKNAVQMAANSLAAGLPVADANKILETTVNEVHSINRASVFDEGSVADDVVNMWKEYQEISSNPFSFKGVMSGYASLDSITNGFFGGQLIIIAGFEGSGKSMLSMNMAVNAWMGSNTIDTKVEEFTDDGKNVIYFSLEMPRSNRGEVSRSPNLNKRIISCIGKVPDDELRKGILDPEQRDRLARTCKFVKKYDHKKKLYIVDMPRGATATDIEVKILELREQFPIDLVAVDYIGLMDGEDDSDWEQQGKTAERLHELGRVYRFPVITPVQMTRPGSANHSLNKQNYNNTRVSRSKMITENANLVLMIESRDNEEQYPDMRIHITKNRDGRKGTLTFLKDFPHMRITDDASSLAVIQGVDKFVDLGDDE